MAVLIIFPFIFHTVINVRMLSRYAVKIVWNWVSCIFSSMSDFWILSLRKLNTFDVTYVLGRLWWTLFLCISAHLTVLLLLNPLFKSHLLPITSSHSHFSTSDSTFEHWHLQIFYWHWPSKAGLDVWLLKKFVWFHHQFILDLCNCTVKLRYALVALWFNYWYMLGSLVGNSTVLCCETSCWGCNPNNWFHNTKL